jgi:hypothetical protein
MFLFSVQTITNAFLHTGFKLFNTSFKMHWVLKKAVKQMMSNTPLQFRQILYILDHIFQVQFEGNDDYNYN